MHLVVLSVISRYQFLATTILVSFLVQFFSRLVQQRGNSMVCIGTDRLDYLHYAFVLSHRQLFVVICSQLTGKIRHTCHFLNIALMCIIGILACHILHLLTEFYKTRGVIIFNIVIRLVIILTVRGVCVAR